MQKCLAIIIVDDCVVEENGEEFYIHLKNTPDLDHRIKLSSEPAVITINDDDCKNNELHYRNQFLIFCISAMHI